MPRLPSRFGRRLGYRGLALTMFGAMFIVIGLGTWAHPGYVPELVHTHLPLWLRVGIWAGCGLVGMVTAWFARAQFVGFAALVIPPVERAYSYGYALVSGPNVERLSGTALYLLLAATLLLFAAWPEPTKPTGGDQCDPNSSP